jgi:hypothetical protein
VHVHEASFRQALVQSTQRFIDRSALLSAPLSPLLVPLIPLRLPPANADSASNSRRYGRKHSVLETRVHLRWISEGRPVRTNGHSATAQQEQCTGLSMREQDSGSINSARFPTTHKAFDHWYR